MLDYVNYYRHVFLILKTDHEHIYETEILLIPWMLIFLPLIFFSLLSLLIFLGLRYSSFFLYKALECTSLIFTLLCFVPTLFLPHGLFQLYISSSRVLFHLYFSSLMFCSNFIFHPLMFYSNFIFHSHVLFQLYFFTLSCVVQCVASSFFPYILTHIYLPTDISNLSL